MPTNKIGIWDGKNNYGRWVRIYVVQAHTTTITPTSEPEWDDSASATVPGGSNFHRLPKNAFALLQTDPTGDGEAFSTGDAKFTDGLPWGMTETASWQVRANLGAMQSSVTDQEFAAALVDYIFPSGGTISSGTSYQRTFDTTTRIIVRIADAGTAIADFSMRFDGVLRPKPQKAGEIIPGATAIIDLELDHIAKAVLDIVTMADVCNRCVNTSYGSGSTISPHVGDGGSGYNRVYDFFHWLFEPVDQLVKGFHRAHLLLAAQQCCNDAYSALTRQSSSGVWNFRFRSNGEDATNYHGTPWDHWTYFEHDGTIFDERSTAVPARYAYFLGTVALDSAPTDYVAGLLIAPIQGEGQTLHSYPTLWDFLVEACDDGACKGVISSQTFNRCEIYFRRLKESGSITTLTLNDLKSKAGPTEAPAAIAYTINESVIMGADVSVRQQFGDDRGAYSTSEGAQSEGSAPIKCIWDTMPTVGGTDWIVVRSTEDIDYGDRCGGVMREWPFWKLFYVQNAGGAFTQKVLMRVHDSVRIDDGDTTHDYGVASSGSDPGWVTLPHPIVTANNPRNDGWAFFIKPMRIQLLKRQTYSSSHYALANHAMLHFGPDAAPITWRLVVLESIIGTHRLGDTFRIGPSPYTANNILGTGETYLESLSTEGRLVSMKLNDSSDLADIEVLA